MSQTKRHGRTSHLLPNVPKLVLYGGLVLVCWAGHPTRSRITGAGPAVPRMRLGPRDHRKVASPQAYLMQGLQRS